MRLRAKDPTASELPPVDCFLYCGLMDPAALAKLGIHAPVLRPARLRGWRITFTPQPDIVPAKGHEVDGFLTSVSMAELDALRESQGTTGYRPLPVQVHTEDGAPAALAFVHGGPPAAPDAKRLAAYLETCWRLGMPEAHCAQLQAEAQRLAPKRKKVA